MITWDNVIIPTLNTPTVITPTLITPTIITSTPKQGFSQIRVRRAQAFLIRAPNASSVVWPCCYGEYDVPADMQ
jgi:hypothetical protein